MSRSRGSFQPTIASADVSRQPPLSPLRADTSSFEIECTTHFHSLIIEQSKRFSEAQKERSGGEKTRDDQFSSLLNSLRESFNESSQERFKRLQEMVVKNGDSFESVESTQRKRLEESIRTWNDMFDKSFDIRRDKIDRIDNDSHIGHRRLSDDFCLPYQSLERSFEELSLVERGRLDERLQEWSEELRELMAPSIPFVAHKSEAAVVNTEFAAQRPVLSPTPNSSRSYNMGGSIQGIVLSRPFRPLPRTESPPSEELQTPFEKTSDVSPSIPSGMLPAIQSSTSPASPPHRDTPPAVDNALNVTPTSNTIPAYHNDRYLELLLQFDRDFQNELDKWESLFVDTEFYRDITAPAQRMSQFESLRKELHHQFGKEIQRFNTQVQERVKGWEASDLASEQQYADMVTYQQRNFRRQMDQLRKSFHSERREGDYFRKERVHRIFERIESQLLLAIQEHQGIFEEWQLYWKHQLKLFTQEAPVSPPRLTTRGSGGPSTKLEPETQLSMRSLFRSVGGATRTFKDGVLKSASLGPTVFRQTRSTFQSNTQLNIQETPHAAFMRREREWHDIFVDMMSQHNTTFQRQELERDGAFKLVFSVFTEKKENMDRKFLAIFESQLKTWDGDLSREAEIRKSKFETRMVEWEEQFNRDQKKRENDFALALREFQEAEAIDDIEIRTEFTRWTMEVNSQVEKEKLRWKEEFLKISRVHEQIHTDLCLLADFPGDQSDSEDE